MKYIRQTLCPAVVLLALLPLWLISCGNKRSAESPVTEQQQAAVYEAKLTPFTVSVQGNTATVGFVETDRAFTLNLDTPEGARALPILKNAIGTGTPLKITAYEGTQQIVRVDTLSAKEVEAHRSLFTQTPPKADYVAQPIIPNQVTLDQLFTLIRNVGCTTFAPVLPATPCNTYRYITDGCYARAHKMWQILLAYGYTCRKQFVYGRLAASNGNCCVSWGWHVAPLVQFRNAAGYVEERIIDPSMFPWGPVTQEVWRGACANPRCAYDAVVTGYINTDPAVYLRNPATGQAAYDPGFAKTDCILTAYNRLQGCEFGPFPGACGF